MRYMLFKAGQNQSFPVARDKLTALVTKKYPKKHGLGQAVVAKAQASFAKVMGMEMRELTKTSPTGETDRPTAIAERPNLPSLTPSSCFFLHLLNLEKASLVKSSTFFAASCRSGFVTLSRFERGRKAGRRRASS